MRTKTTNSIPVRVVVIGGGTGNSTVLSGLKAFVGPGLTAIVNTFDDGGGTGKLRDEYEDMPAVGDLRQCLRALSSLPEAELALLNHRFHAGKDSSIGLHGQMLGNLFLAAASQYSGGNFVQALNLVSRMYAITGRVLAVSHDPRRLYVTLPDGRLIKGQHATELVNTPSIKGATVGFDKAPTRISEEARKAIEQADMVVLAPGDLYTSIAPNLVVDGMKEALEQAKVVVLVTNLMNRSRHTAGFTALDYAEEYERLIGSRVIDRIIYNTEKINPQALREQAALGSHPVTADVMALKKAGYTPIGKNLVSKETVVLNPNDSLAGLRSTIRHDPEKVALALMATYFGDGLTRK